MKAHGSPAASALMWLARHMNMPPTLIMENAPVTLMSTTSLARLKTCG
jgi:hypothetical protein